jgi:hypothetical protein
MNCTSNTATMNARLPLTPSTGAADSYDIALERHFTIQEIAVMWSVSDNTARRTFCDEPGVLSFGSEERLYKRGRKILRIPESVLLRVHRRLRAVN